MNLKERIEAVEAELTAAVAAPYNMPHAVVGMIASPRCCNKPESQNL